MAKPRKITEPKTKKETKSKKEPKAKAVKKKPLGYKLNFEPRSAAQKEVLSIIKDHDISFVTGVTGTGKTFLSTVAALRYVYNRKSPINKIIIVRPAVSAQEDIGALPGNADEKLAHYIAPVLEHIVKLVGKEEFEHLKERDMIEIVPVAFLRGRNFENSFIIFDEAQNANRDQFKLCITRIADNSKIAICGDVEQCDIYQQDSGLMDAIPRFIDDSEFGFISLPESEIQRHPIVAKILKKYREDLGENLTPSEVPALDCDHTAESITLNLSTF